ncbi:LacI family DNA-binding transcriptional regulator [Kribbella sp. VKM Ac-2566]|uniref:LacI family DNA-binding transcriptional regulator n=1 Tax=Kribbella sp. VKM Ac-2566 TaxID=2512218 RepID=UPI0010623C4C|nr:LacI family DNA-binding transcriptional regulator [Kribbella sp. VKM Ac-2566]TDW88978.1 LacI family transcriptional regulator [Kribbella sp. VKM Ac-2566]
MVTMKDVAQRAGVSIATVSFLLNDTKPVTAATRARIEQAMLDLGYRRNMVARALASRRTHIIAMAYPALEHRFGMSTSEFFTSAAEAARKDDYHLVLWPVGNDGVELRELLGQGLVDGVVLMEVQLDDPRIDVLQQAGTPFALIGRTTELEGLSHVDIDFDTTVEDAVRHLREHGHHELVLISGDLDDPRFHDYGPWVRTEEAYRRVVASYDLPIRIIPCSDTTQAGKAAAARVLTEYPEATAILVLNEYAALGVVAGLKHTGHDIPRDFSVLSLLTVPETAAMADPELTMMRTPGPELGQLGTQALLRQLEGDDLLPPQLVPAKLCPGATVAGPRAPRSKGGAGRRGARKARS